MKQPPCRLVATIGLAVCGIMATGGIVLCAALNVEPPPLLTVLAGACVGYLAGLITPSDPQSPRTLPPITVHLPPAPGQRPER